MCALYKVTNKPGGPARIVRGKMTVFLYLNQLIIIINKLHPEAIAEVSQTAKAYTGTRHFEQERSLII